MKKIYILPIALIMLTACKSNNNTIDFRHEMRQFVIEISQYARAKEGHDKFIVIPQNGIELVTLTDDSSGDLANDYLSAIDGHGQEDLFYGYNNDDEATPEEESNYLMDYLNLSKAKEKVILVTDYCSTEPNVTNSYTKNKDNGFVSFAANRRELDSIPSIPSPIYNENIDSITKLNQIRNFLYLINPSNYANKTEFIDAVCDTNYDALIMDAFFKDGTAFSADEVAQLRDKDNAGKRLVIAYMSIGEAENYRYYWQEGWTLRNPDWLDEENPDWPGNYKVRYWDKDWKSIIYGNGNAYLDRILAAGFDGVYLDIIEAFEYFE